MLKLFSLLHLTHYLEIILRYHHVNIACNVLKPLCLLLQSRHWPETECVDVSVKVMLSECNMCVVPGSKSSENVGDSSLPCILSGTQYSKFSRTIEGDPSIFDDEDIQKLLQGGS